MHTDLTPRFNDWNSTVAAINRKCGRKAFVNCRTDFPEQRRLGLAICGWNYEGEELEQELGRYVWFGLLPVDTYGTYS